MNPASGPVPASNIEIRFERGTSMPGRAWCASDPRALIAIVHGLGEHSGRYAALAGDLVRARFTVVALDLPGHGEARGPRGDIPSWTRVRDQIVPLLFTASRGLPGQPLKLPHVLPGHGMGGVMALDYALAHPREILAVVAVAPALMSVRPKSWKLALAMVGRVVAPSAGFPHGIDEGGMSRDPEVLALRKSDRRVHGRISPRLLFAFEEARRRVMREARQLKVPALLLHGAADRVVDPHGSLEFCGAAPHDLCRLLTYRDASHEIYNDPGREQAVRDLVGWLDAVLVV